MPGVMQPDNLDTGPGCHGWPCAGDSVRAQGLAFNGAEYKVTIIQPYTEHQAFSLFCLAAGFQY